MKRSLRWAALVGAAVLLLAGCASPGGEDPAVSATAAVPGETTDDDTSASDDAGDEAVDGPRTQAETCDWDAPALTGAADAPGGQDGDVHTVIVGAWQHTHVDTGSGFEPVSEDIRYVFPSDERLLYCQHVAGVTDHAENSADITWDGTRIVLPGGAPGFVVQSWDDAAMVWVNRLDNSIYLLQRR